MIINRIYENQNLVAVACFLPGWAKDLSAPLYKPLMYPYMGNSMSNQSRQSILYQYKSLIYFKYKKRHQQLTLFS